MKYEVYHNVGVQQVLIAREGYEPQGLNDQGAALVGTFELDVNEDNNATTAAVLQTADGTQRLVAEARKLLTEKNDETGFGGLSEANINRLSFLDRASNAPSHDEENFSTDALPRSEPGTDPEISSQAGGEASSVGTDPETKEPNGVQDAGERTDEPAEPVTEEGESEQTGPAETVEQLKQRISKITDPEKLQAEYDKEQNGANRSTAIKAFEDRAKELQG